MEKTNRHQKPLNDFITEDYYTQDNCEESHKNEEFNDAMNLFNFIIVELKNQDFTFNDIKDASLQGARKVLYKNMFNGVPATSYAPRKAINFLVKNDFLLFDKKTKEYSINHVSSKVAKIMMED